MVLISLVMQTDSADVYKLLTDSNASAASFALVRSIVALCNRKWTREANSAADMMSRIVDDSRHHMVISEEVPVDLIRCSWLSSGLPCSDLVL
ncbi:hypothetical protein V6N11_076115 [Hibiscus sabdariffa]|uniref:RNase H type-1 domain-containing protein n=1 Tax=Hibiscus sabdariffa TaxID=183260 RepID=A0ABR2Q5A1_9ROSI